MDGGSTRRLVAVCDDATAARLRRIAPELELAIAGGIEDAGEGDALIVVGDPTALAGDARITHVVRSTVPDDQLLPLLSAIARGAPVAPPAATERPADASDARRAQVAFTLSRKLAAATDAESIERLAVDAVLELCDVDRASCLFYDAGDGSLWSEAKLRGAGDSRHASAGIAGWAARTGLAAMVSRAGDDPRWLAAIDDPDGDASSELLVQPVLASDGQVHAILIAARRARSTRLAADAAVQLRRFAALIAPMLDQLSSHVQAQELANEDHGDALFRREAIDAAEPRRWGDVVRVSPAWLGWSYWVFVGLIVASVAFVSLASVSTYSMGPAVIRSTARSSVTARTAGNVTIVEVMPGDRVDAGRVIAWLDDVDQRAAVERIDREFETQLRNHMLDPSDLAADATLRTLRVELERARTALAERAIVAPAAGTVSDLRVRPGQHVEPGDIAASIVDGSSALEVVALLPGEDRPQLSPGMKLRLEVAGYQYAYQALVIDSVSSDVIAPSEARRVLGAEVADGLRLGGSVVLVRGRIPSGEFTVDGRTFRYHDGMRGTAEVRVRSERVVFALVPGLRSLR